MAQYDEDRLWNAHSKEGEKRYGKRWESANIGWYSGGDIIESKVYGDATHKTEIFISKEIDGNIEHFTQDYGK